MKRIAVALLSLLLLVAGAPAWGTEAVPLPETSEVIKVLRSHYVDKDKLDEKLLNNASIAGILRALGQGAMIVTPEPAGSNVVEAVPATSNAGLPLARAEVIEPDIGYIRIADVVEQTVSAVDAELKKFADAKVIGYVLDLRFADGTNFTAAADVASRFVPAEQELFALKSSEHGEQVFRSGTNPLVAEIKGLADAPLMILVNAETSGAAEVLAGALHMQHRGILLGTKTAGSAAAWEDIKLSDGRVLRLASAKIMLPSPEQQNAMTVDVFPDGITPDIAVKIDPKVEREAVLNVQTNVTLTASLQPREVKKRMGEAELVKAFRGEAIDLKLGVTTNVATETKSLVPKMFNGGTFEAEPSATNAPPSSAPRDAGESKPAVPGDEEREIQQVRDVVLQHAVDVLKGIRVLLSWRQ
jgi:hypothetical protein